MEATKKTLLIPEGKFVEFVDISFTACYIITIISMFYSFLIVNPQQLLKIYELFLHFC